MSVFSWFRRDPKTENRKRPVRRVRRFDAGVSNTLIAWFKNFVANINEDLKGDLVTMRDRARHMAQNEPMARKYLSLLAANVIGSNGIMLQSRVLEDITPRGTAEPKPDTQANLAIEEAWKRFNRKGGMDASGRQSGKAFCATVLKTVARDGYALIRENLDADNEFKYSLSLLDGSRIATNLNRNADENGVAVIMGVEVDSNGKHLAYYLTRDAYGDTRTSRGGEIRVSAENYIYLAQLDYPEQVHGYTWMHAALPRMRTLGKYQDAALTASAVGAMKMGFYTQDPDTGVDGANPSLADDEDSHGPIQSAEAAHFEVLEPGMGFQSFDPDYPHAMYEPFVKGAKRDISSALDVSYHAVANDLEGVNFSSIRSGTLEDREQYKMTQEWFIDHFLEHVFLRMLRFGLLRGAIKHPYTGNALPAAKFEKFSRHRFIGRRWEWVDPLKDENANAVALKNLMDSPYRILTQKGLDPDEVLDDLQKFQQAALDRGLNPDFIAGVMQQAADTSKPEDSGNADSES